MDLQTTPVRVRFAPSPTGYLHIGGARTALFNYLYARKTGGRFILRIEDTDLKREKDDSIKRILDDMQWLGISWDEGPIRQTDRLDVYMMYAKKLEEEGKVYPCYCTPEELQQKREKMMAEKINPRYDGTCRNLSPAQQKKLEEEGRKPALRFSTPVKAVTVNDLIRGNVTYEEDFAGDFIVMKSDGTPSYNFAVVIDDYEMGVNIVMRGEEHLVNTPRQILLYEALQFPLPAFAHISMILSPDRRKLSKRHGTVAVDLFQQEGYLPEALVNYIALLGWSPADDREFFTIDELIEEFSLERIAKNPAVYDVEKLKWMNGQYVRKMDSDKLLDYLYPYMEEAGFFQEETPSREKLILIIEAVKSNLTLLRDIQSAGRVFFGSEIQIEKDAEECLSWDTTPVVLQAFIETLDEFEDITQDNFMDLVKKIQKKSGAKGKKLYVPLRAGITGQAHGPEMALVLTALSPKLMKTRLKKVLSLITN